MVKHIMLHQKLLLRGKFDEKRERNSCSGYILDYNASPLTEAELLQVHVTLTTIQISQLVELSHWEASAICKDLLHMILPKLGTMIVPLAGPGLPQKKSGMKSCHVVNSESESDCDYDDWDGDDEDKTNEDGESEEGAEGVDEAGTVTAAIHE